jgi:hypothetical protein
MASQKTRKRRVKVSLWVSLTLMPAAAGFGAFKMATSWTIVIATIWLFILGIAAFNHDWKRPRMRQVMDNSWIQWSAAAMLFVTGGWAAGAAHKPAVVDPEATENKYVRIMRVPSQNASFEYAILVEFGVMKVNSEGFVVGVCPAVEQFDLWYGLPGRTDRQTDFVVFSHEKDAQSNTLWVRMPEFNISPRRSYYLCLLSHTEQDIKPEGIMYFAVAANEKALVWSQRDKIGHQYQPRE